MEETPLSPPALRVLQTIRERSMDGYMVLAKAHLTPEELSTALSELQNREAVSIKGSTRPELVGETYLSVPPSAIRYVDFLLGRLRFSSMR